MSGSQGGVVLNMNCHAHTVWTNGLNGKMGCFAHLSALHVASFLGFFFFLNRYECLFSLRFVHALRYCCLWYHMCFLTISGFVVLNCLISDLISDSLKMNGIHLWWSSTYSAVEVEPVSTFWWLQSASCCCWQYDLGLWYQRNTVNYTTQRNIMGQPNVFTSSAYYSS